MSQILNCHIYVSGDILPHAKSSFTMTNCYIHAPESDATTQPWLVHDTATGAVVLDMDSMFISSALPKAISKIEMLKMLVSRKKFLAVIIDPDLPSQVLGSQP